MSSAQSIDTDIVIQQLSDGYVEVDLDGYIVKYNLAAQKLFEGKTNKLFGINFPKLFEEHSQNTISTIFKKLLKEGELHKFEATIRGKKEAKHVEISANLLYNRGKPNAVFNIIRDVTDTFNKQRESAILAERLINAEGAANLGCFEYIIDTPQKWWSKQMFKIYDLKENSKVPEDDFIMSVCHPDDKEALEKQYTLVNKDKKDYNITHRVITNKGNLKWLKKKGSYKKDDQGLTKFFGTVQDVTDLYQEKEQNRRNHRIIEIVNEAQQFLIAEGNPYKVLQKCCKYLATQTGTSYVYIYKNDGLNGDYTLSVHSNFASLDNRPEKRHNAAKEGLEKWHNRLRQGKILDSGVGKISPKEKSFLEKLGVVSTLIIPIHIEKKFFGFLGFDNTNQPHYWLDTEKEILSSFAKKLGFFMQRAEFLEELEQNLIREQKQNIELSKINKEIDSFVYATFHDLRAPIMNMQGLLSMFKFEKHTAQEILPKFEKLVNKLHNAVSEIGDYAKNLRIPLQYVDINIKDLREYINNQFERLNSKQNVAFSFDTSGQKKFSTDLMRFGIVMQNLLENAIFFSQTDKKPKVIISITVNSKNILVSIVNNGDSIKKDALESIFDMFTVFNTRSEGSGLGLYIAKEAINSLGGRIKASSTSKQTTFEFQIPNHNNAIH